MASKKQIEANRLNATKSTGPRTPEGKARSSMNALKSGINAKAQIIRGEKAVDLESLKADYYDRFHPATPEQRMLVDTLIDCEWLLRRFRVCEAQLWEEGASVCMRPNPEVEVAQGFRNMVDYFAAIQRRIDTAHRNYRNALQELRRLKAEEDLEPAPVVSSSEVPSAVSGTGFVPQTIPSQSPVSAVDPTPTHPSPLRALAPNPWLPAATSGAKPRVGEFC